MSFIERGKEYFNRKGRQERKRANEGKESYTPKPFHTIVVDNLSSVVESVTEQKKAIEAMLSGDTTGQGKVVVLVDNPLHRNLYSTVVSNELTQGVSFTDAEKKAYLAKQETIPVEDLFGRVTTAEDIDNEMEWSKTPLSRASSAMIDELLE